MRWLRRGRSHPQSAGYGATASFKASVSVRIGKASVRWLFMLSLLLWCRVVETVAPTTVHHAKATAAPEEDGADDIIDLTPTAAQDEKEVSDENNWDKSSVSSGAATEVQSGNDSAGGENNSDADMHDYSQEDHDADNNALQATVKMVFKNKATGASYTTGYRGTVSIACSCTGTQSDSSCQGATLTVSSATLGRRLNIDPGSGIHNETMDCEMLLHWPWEERIDNDAFGPVPSEDEFGDPSLFSTIGWHENCNAIYQVPVHTCGPFEIVVSGQPLVNPCALYERDVDVSCEDERVLRNDEDLDVDSVPSVSLYSATEKAIRDTTESSENVTHHSDSSTEHDLDEVDDYELEYHRNVFNYLEFSVYPTDLRFGKDTVRRKKYWSQNARRRYSLIVNEDDDDAPPRYSTLPPLRTLPALFCDAYRWAQTFDSVRFAGCICYVGSPIRKNDQLRSPSRLLFVVSCFGDASFQCTSIPWPSC